MNTKRIESFENLKHGDKIISPIDNEVTGVYVDKNGKCFLEASGVRMQFISLGQTISIFMMEIRALEKLMQSIFCKVKM